ncbi:MAG: hypothetical protein FWG25_06530 [Promicromonosporaceae bacterium]|nr:hypothetical protein [Promicromonosporaceae bacterium]
MTSIPAGDLHAQPADATTPMGIWYPTETDLFDPLAAFTKFAQSMQDWAGTIDTTPPIVEPHVNNFVTVTSVDAQRWGPLCALAISLTVRDGVNWTAGTNGTRGLATVTAGWRPILMDSTFWAHEDGGRLGTFHPTGAINLFYNATAIRPGDTIRVKVPAFFCDSGVTRLINHNTQGGAR